MREQNRWWVVGVFYLSSAVNYLDRFILGAVSPAFMMEFGLNYEQFGWILTAFSTVYMLSSPLAGWFLDRMGLNLGTSVALGWWSLAGMARGLTGGLGGLVATHSLVAVGEAAGIPSTAKAAQNYLKQEERAIGSAMSQVGLVIGMMLAAGIANYAMANWGWRSAFFVAGWLGLAWIPLWYWASRKAPIQPAAPESTGYDTRGILRERQMWGFVGANILSLGIFLLWTNWTNHYFRVKWGMTTAAANQLAPLLQAIALGGSLMGGYGSMRLIRRGVAPLRARRSIWLVGALGMTLSALVPIAPSVPVAVGLIGLSYLASSAASVNLYTMPLDAYGGSRAAFAVSLLTSGYGALQLVSSPLIGWVADRHGFDPICVAVAFPPLLGYFLLKWTQERGAQTLGR
ncbi:MAG: MFS transporter [Bryobacter sp.]|jgi:ACS family hexuronate transporter-like MFS transporter|nr:MFS transporter [Bryobacter sp. CoA8 C33]